MQILYRRIQWKGEARRKKESEERETGE